MELNEIRIVIEGKRGRRVYDAETIGRFSLTIETIIEEFGRLENGGLYDFVGSCCETIDDSDTAYYETRS